MKRFSLALALILFLPLLPFSQETTSPPPWLKPNVLEAENLIFSRDTGGLKVVSASRSNKFIDDLPVTILYPFQNKKTGWRRYLTNGRVIMSRLMMF